MLNNKQVKRQRCEVYSRVVGYLRPVQQYSDAKQAEYMDRKNFVVNKISNK